MAAELRIFPSPQEVDAPRQQTPCVLVDLGELLPILAQAYRENYLWLQDFLDEQVAVSPDLYEVISSFRCYRPSA